MQRLKLQALLNAMGAIAMWTVLTLLFGDNTAYLLMLGVFASIGVGVGTYWWGKRFQHEEQRE